MSGEAFQPATIDADPKTFDIKQWRRGAALVTRSVDVFGRPDLLGVIEALDDEVVRLQGSDFDDDRPEVKQRATEIARQAEAFRRQMAESVQTFRFRGLRPGELEEIKREHGPVDGKGITDLDYKVWARQCVSPAGLTWEDFKELHRGDESGAEDATEGLGNYFLQTIGRAANLANEAGGVDIPFSQASSLLIATSSTS